MVVDAPAGIRVEGLASPGPPRVGARNLAGRGTSHVYPAQACSRGAVNALHGLTRRAQDAVKVGTLARQKAGTLDVALPVLDVELAVTDIEVAHHGGESVVARELRHARLQGIEKLPLLFLLGRVHLARVHVATHHGEGGITHAVFGFEPPTGGVKVVRPDGHAVNFGRTPARDRDAGTSLGRGGIVQDIPIGSQQIFQIARGGAHLLQSQDVDVAFVQPGTHALTKCGAHAVNVDGGKAKSCHGRDSLF